MSDFSDKPLVAGSLTGLRAFKVDELGRLVSPHRPTVFTPDENVATCKRHPLEDAQLGLERMLSAYGSSFGPPVAPRPTLVGQCPRSPFDPNVKHRAGHIDCRCGWYAYFDGSNDSKDQYTIAALIEGYGTCTLGSRGFRAELARLVAVIAPGRKSTIPPARIARLVANYPDIPVYAKKATALEAHPLTAPQVPTPATHPDFWEMGIRS